MDAVPGGEGNVTVAKLFGDLLCCMQHATTTDGGLEMYPGAGTANIGIMLFRTTAKVFAEVRHTLPLHPAIHPHARLTPAMLV